MGWHGRWVRELTSEVPSFGCFLFSLFSRLGGRRQGSPTMKAEYCMVLDKFADRVRDFGYLQKATAALAAAEQLS